MDWSQVPHALRQTSIGGLMRRQDPTLGSYVVQSWPRNTPDFELNETFVLHRMATLNTTILGSRSLGPGCEVTPYQPSVPAVLIGGEHLLFLVP